MVQNADEMCELFSEMQECFKADRNVSLDFNDVRVLTTDALIVLLAKIKDHDFTSGLNVRGNTPRQPELRQLMAESDFYSAVSTPSSGHWPRFGQIRERQDYLVDPTVAQDLVNFATAQLHGSQRPCKGVQRILLEAMANTRDHAAGLPHANGKKWWSLVYCRNNVAHFTLVDSGVGIFKSVKLTKLKAAARAVGLTSNGDLLRELLLGTLGSRTGLPYRGKGLPAIHRVLQRGQVSRLVIIANDTYADLPSGTFLHLKNYFGGTMLYWQLEGPAK
jgi:hypothetical protein